ncbi:MAG: substrate-binding domain-containing protein, partial [Campylobacterota bacterium]
AKGVDAIIVSPVDAAVVAPVIDKAYDKGIKIVFAIRAADTQKYHTYIHPDDRLIAQDAAKYIISRQEQPRVVMIQGKVGANTVTNRKEGFEEVFKRNSDAQIVEIAVGNYNPDEALAVMDQIIQSKIEFNAVYTHNDAMQEGVRIALAKNGIDFDAVTLVGIDYIKESQRAIQNGQMDATFTYPTAAKEIAFYTDALLRNKAVDKEIIVTSIRITKDNVDKVTPLF